MNTARQYAVAATRYRTKEVEPIYCAALYAATAKRCVQITVILYVVLVTMLLEKGYQEVEVGESSIIAKVKGVQQLDWSHSPNEPISAVKTLDAADFVYPALENSAMFITTNVICTPLQRPSVCPEDQRNFDAYCLRDGECEAGQAVYLGSGYKTGVCNMSTQTCMVHTWCPLTLKKFQLSTPMLSGAENATLLVKNFISFPRLGHKKMNILKHDLETCRYHPVTDPYCPIISIGDLIHLAGEDYSNISYYGAVFSYHIKWDCDFDWSPALCMPQYTFRRLDDASSDRKMQGWHFEVPNYWGDTDEGLQKRTLRRMYGIRIIFKVHATARRFNFRELILHLGAGIGIFHFATEIFDWVVFHCAMRSSRKNRRQVTLMASQLLPLSLRPPAATANTPAMTPVRQQAQLVSLRPNDMTNDVVPPD